MNDFIEFRSDVLSLNSSAGVIYTAGTYYDWPNAEALDRENMKAVRRALFEADCITARAMSIRLYLKTHGIVE